VTLDGGVPVCPVSTDLSPVCLQGRAQAGMSLLPQTLATSTQENQRRLVRMSEV
jgi:hypothetical protein